MKKTKCLLCGYDFEDTKMPSNFRRGGVLVSVHDYYKNETTGLMCTKCMLVIGGIFTSYAEDAMFDLNILERNKE